MSKTALIDGDLLFYAIIAAAEYGVDPDEVDLDEVYHAMEVRACNVMLEAGCTKRRIFLTRNNFRHFLIGDYKANRKDTWRPTLLPQVRTYAEMFMGAEIVEYLEADDLMAINQTEDTVICTIDKDLLQVVGNHYRWAYNGKDGELLTMSQGASDERFYIQLLTGDATDGIIGCGIKTTQVYKSGAKTGQEYVRRKGVGQKAAEKIIRACLTPQEMEHAILAEYAAVFGHEQAMVKMIQQARLLYMVREFDGKFAKMWTPIGMDDEWMNIETGEWRLDG